MKYICTLVICIILLPVHAQEITITGTVYSMDDNKGLPNVSITIRSKETGKILTFATSKPSGEFAIETTKEKVSGASIGFSYIGFKTVTENLSGENQTFQISLIPEAVNIREVLVKAPRIRAQGDTIVYNVASFAKDYDRSIGDVLKKMPGIEVKESGQIYFNGEAINKFYIEGSDLLGGKYGIATNSISSKDVSTVEVLQDHQPVRALEGLSFSDKAAINIKLKEDAKYKWVGAIEGGTGFSPFLWNAQLTAMRFTKKLQTINTYKTNNTGTDIIQEFTSFDLKDIKNESYKLPDYINLVPQPSFGLDRKRELFNRTHQVTTNNLTKLKNDFELKMNSSYMDHRETGNHTTETIYRELQGDTTRITEDELSKHYSKELIFGLVLEANKSKYNLTNKLTGNLSWLDKNVTMTGSYPNRQKMNATHHRLSNDLYLLRRFGKDFVTIESYTIYQNHPQQLNVSRASLSQGQNIDQSGFLTDNKAGYGFALGKIVTSFTAGIGIMQKSLKTNLNGMNPESNNPDGDIQFGYVHSSLTPRFEYNFWNIKTVLSMPVNYYTYTYKNKHLGRKATHTPVLFTPELYLSMDVTSRLEISASGEIGKSDLNEKLFYPAVIMSDYRSLSTGFPEFAHGTQKSLSGSITYKRPLDELFSSLSFTRSWNETPYTLTQSFADGYMYSSYLSNRNQSRTWFLFGFFNKGLDFLKGYFFLNASWMKNDAMLIRNDSQLFNSRTNFIITPRIETSPVGWLVVNYALNYNYSTMSLEDDAEKMKTNNISQSLLIRFLASSKLNFTLRGEHYYNEISGTERKHFVLADVSASYRFAKRLELTLNITNLLNQKNYSYMSFADDVSAVYHNYHIRPRNVLFSMYYIY